MGNEGDSNTINRNEKEAKVRRHGNRGKMTGVEDGLPWPQALLQIIAHILCPWAFSVASYINDEVGQGLKIMSLPCNCLFAGVSLACLLLATKGAEPLVLGSSGCNATHCMHSHQVDPVWHHVGLRAREQALPCSNRLALIQTSENFSCKGTGNKY